MKNCCELVWNNTLWNVWNRIDSAIDDYGWWVVRSGHLDSGLKPFFDQCCECAKMEIKENLRR